MLYRKGPKIPKGFLITPGLIAIPASLFRNDWITSSPSIQAYGSRLIVPFPSRARSAYSGGSLTRLTECKPPFRQIPHALPQVIHEENHNLSLEH